MGDTTIRKIESLEELRKLPPGIVAILGVFDLFGSHSTVFGKVLPSKDWSLRLEDCLVLSKALDVDQGIPPHLVDYLSDHPPLDSSGPKLEEGSRFHLYSGSFPKHPRYPLYVVEER